MSSICEIQSNQLCRECQDKPILRGESLCEDCFLAADDDCCRDCTLPLYDILIAYKEGTFCRCKDEKIDTDDEDSDWDGDLDDTPNCHQCGEDCGRSIIAHQKYKKTYFCNEECRREYDGEEQVKTKDLALTESGAAYTDVCEKCDEKEEKKRIKDNYDAFWLKTYGYTPKTVSNEEFDKKFPNTDINCLLKGLKMPSANDLKTIVKNSRK